MREHLGLNMAFSIDRIFSVMERVEWNQIYRYDHLMKDKPLSYERFEKMFATEYDGGLLVSKDGHKHHRRYGMILDRNQIGSIVQGGGRFEMADLMAHRDRNEPFQAMHPYEEGEDGEDMGDGEGVELDMEDEDGDDGDDGDEGDGDGEEEGEGDD